MSTEFKINCCNLFRNLYLFPDITSQKNRFNEELISQYTTLELDVRKDTPTGSNIPVRTRRYFDIHTTSFWSFRRCIDVKTTSCAHWDFRVIYLCFTVYNIMFWIRYFLHTFRVYSCRFCCFFVFWLSYNKNSNKLSHSYFFQDFSPVYTFVIVFILLFSHIVC